MRISKRSMIVGVLALGCSMEAPVVQGGPDNGSSSGGSDNTPMAGSTSTGGTGNVLPPAGGSAAMAGSASTAGSSNGGTGGSDATGGSAPMGGSAALGGSAPMGGSAAMGGSSGENLMDVVKALNGLHLDDVCGNISNDTCIHVKTNPFEDFKEVTIGGTPGTVYDVTVHFQGVFETANISGGTEPAEFKDDKVTVDGLTFRKTPMTIDGTVADPTYEPWYFQVSSPAHTFYLNDTDKVQHTSFKVDAKYVVQMAAGAKVKIDWKDGNDHEITNKNSLTFPELGADGMSKNKGQFLHITIEDIKVHQ